MLKHVQNFFLSPLEVRQHVTMLKFPTQRWFFSPYAHHLTYMSFGVQPALAKAQYMRWWCKLQVFPAPKAQEKSSGGGGLDNVGLTLFLA
jgi:hypothetical protein